MKGSVFISYRREGGDLFASILYRQLKKKNFDVYLDIHNSRQGEWLERILKEVRTRDYIAVVLSSNIFKDWNSEAWKREDDIVFQELDEAVKANKKFVPIMLKGFVIPDPMSFPDDGRREIIKTIRENEIFDFSSMKTEKKNWRDLLKFFYEDTVHPLFIVLGVLALVLVIGGMLLPNLLRDAKDPPSDPETQGQTVVETAPDTTEHQDTDIVTHESESNDEESTDSGTTENEGNTEETIEEGTENNTEKEADNQKEYEIQSFFLVGQTDKMGFDEVYYFSGQTNSPLIKIYMISSDDKWNYLTSIIVDGDTFNFRTQGRIEWLSISRIAVIPCDEYGNEIMERTYYKEVVFSQYNPLKDVSFKQDSYEVKRGEGLTIEWDLVWNVDDVLFLIMITEKNENEPLSGDVVLEKYDFQSNFFHLYSKDTLAMKPGEYSIMLGIYDKSDKYIGQGIICDLTVFE